MQNPNIKTKVVHSQTNNAWNVIGTTLDEKYKIARVPYVCIDNEEITTINRLEALNPAEFISYCFNNANLILNYEETLNKMTYELTKIQEDVRHINNGLKRVLTTP